tara:strand:- start:7170 stop:7832 length:663 start_codon:yes stop_codon:yes gene_type:complete
VLEAEDFVKSIDDLDTLDRKAARGDNEALFNLAIRYANGEGLEKDPEKATQLLLQAADQGYVHAQLLLARLNKSRGEEEGALYWLKRAADQDDLNAQTDLGAHYFEKQDYDNAFKWLYRAARKGHPEAQYGVGILYREGWGVGKNPREAKRWIKQAAMQGNAKAQLQYGGMILDESSKPSQSEAGMVEVDAQAIKWIQKAAAQGLPEAQQVLENLGQSPE